MIDRRRVCLGLSMLPVMPDLARAQASRTPVVGLVLPNISVADMSGAEPRSHLVRGFVQGLADGGCVEGRTVSIERRSAEGDPAKAARAIAELVERRVDVIAVGGSRWLQDAAVKATPSIPLVAVFPFDPVGAGLIRSLGRPGGNLTGVMFAVGGSFTEKQVQLLQEVSPRIKRIAFVAVRAVLDQYLAAATVQSASIIPVGVDAVAEYDAAFDQIRRQQVDAALFAGGPPNVVNAARLASFVVAAGLPALFGFREGVEAGGLMSYGPSIAGTFRQAGLLVAKFLAGARIGEVPAEQPSIFELVLNQKAATALGLSFPTAMRLRAEEVIE